MSETTSALDRKVGRAGLGIRQDVHFAVCFAEAETGERRRGAAGPEQESGFVGSLRKQSGLQLTSPPVIPRVSRDHLFLQGTRLSCRIQMSGHCFLVWPIYLGVVFWISFKTLVQW